MSIAAVVNPEPARARAPRRRLTVDDYHRMGDAGIFHEDDRVELLDGELFQMASIGSLHAGIVIRLQSRLEALGGGRYLVSTQNPIQIPPYSQPQPDIVLLRPRADTYCSALPQPSDVLLLIEVADSSLEWDRDVKIPMYGRYGVIESWLVDLDHRTVTVFRDPARDGYRSAVPIHEGAASPAQLPDIAIALDDLFG